MFGNEDEDFHPQCYNTITGRAGRFCTDGICLVPPALEAAELGYGSWCTPPGDPRLSPLVTTQRGGACADERIVTARDLSGASAIMGLFDVSVECYLQDHPPRPSDGTVCAPRTGVSVGCQQCFDALVQCALVETLCLQPCLSGFQPGSSFTTTPECQRCMRDVGCLAVLDDCAGTTASIDVADPSNSADCAAGTDEINRACPYDEMAGNIAATTRTAVVVGVPSMCTADCAAVFVPWWDQCVDSVVGMEVERQLGRRQLSEFYRSCVEAGAGAASARTEATSTASTGH